MHTLVKTGNGILFFLFLAICPLVNAQFSSTDKDASFKAKYPSNKGTDSVFIFNKPVFDANATISLQATSTDSTSGWSFIWSVYNTTTRSYDIIPKADTGISSTIDTISVSSGYQVIMTKGISSDTFRVWLLFNDFNVVVTNKNDSGEVTYDYRGCESVTLKADTIVYPLWYPEPGTDNRIDTANQYQFTWEADNDLSEDPTGTFTARVNNPPFRDTWYIVTVTDSFNLSRSDSVICPAITSKAAITAEYVTLSDSLEYGDKPYHYYYDDDKSAPGKYRFDLSGSENAASYQIKFGDGEMIETQTDTAKLVHEYKLPGTYTATLITQSPDPYNCVDSFQVENIIIELEPAEFKLPNVFTPNNDGHNDIAKLWDDNNPHNAFRSNDISVFSIEITIFDRIGKKVHEYSGNIRDWKGWDGNVMDSNRKAPDGVYFYCLTRTFSAAPEGSTEQELREEKDTGFIHLYRE